MVMRVTDILSQQIKKTSISLIPCSWFHNSALVLYSEHTENYIWFLIIIAVYYYKILIFKKWTKKCNFTITLDLIFFETAVQIQSGCKTGTLICTP